MAKGLIFTAHYTKRHDGFTVFCCHAWDNRMKRAFAWFNTVWVTRFHNKSLATVLQNNARFGRKYTGTKIMEHRVYETAGVTLLINNTYVNRAFMLGEGTLEVY